MGRFCAQLEIDPIESSGGSIDLPSTNGELDQSGWFCPGNTVNSVETVYDEKSGRNS